MEKNSGNDPIEEGSAPVPAEGVLDASLALAAPYQPEFVVDSLGLEEFDRSSMLAPFSTLNLIPWYISSLLNSFSSIVSLFLSSPGPK
jgi:hypothetical protein